MDGPEGIRLAAIVLLVLASLVAVALVIAIIQIRRLSAQVEATMRRLETDVSLTLRRAQSTLERVDNLAAGLDTMVREQVSPSIDSVRSTIANATSSMNTLSQGVSRVQRVANMVQTVTGAGAVAGLSRTILRKGGRIGLIALAATAAFQAFTRKDPSEMGRRGQGNPRPPAAASDAPKAKSKDGQRINPSGR
ncbi:MAG TPA: DUF948 domain-containing protein [Candidatus Udaeobacter sp.]|nr:DUF948 domain-containing protein [Candidatus Udaeobacter sp.]